MKYCMDAGNFMGSHEIHSSETGDKSEESFGRAEFILEQIEGVGESLTDLIHYVSRDELLKFATFMKGIAQRISDRLIQRMT